MTSCIRSPSSDRAIARSSFLSLHVGNKETYILRHIYRDGQRKNLQTGAYEIEGMPVMGC